MPETLADIVAEYRRDYEDMKAKRLYLPTAEYLRRLLDRIEAAAKREKADALSAGGLVEAMRHKPSNAAAMREALVKCADIINNFGLAEAVNTAMEVICDIEGVINAALAAPPRNCDVGTELEQAERYVSYCDKFTLGGKHCETCPCCGKIPFGKCEFAWANMPYKEGSAK